MNSPWWPSDDDHGGRLQAARRRHPAAPQPFLDLSTGINPVPYPLPPLEPAAWIRLPEPEDDRALRAAAAHAYGLPGPELVAPCPGTQAAIGLLPFLFPPSRVAVLGPTYAEHAAAWRRAGHDVEEHRCLAECTAAQVVVLCNPNNPTGARLSRDALLACAEERTRKGGVLLVDEAFADFEHAALSVAPALPQPGLIVLRSFGKSYGLPGIRLGFVLAAPDFVQRIREVLGPWPVSGPAIAAGCAALPDTEWRDAAHMRLATDAGRLDALLIAAGMRIVGGTHLFRLAAHERAYALHEELAEAGILTRIFSKHPHWLRIGIPPGQPAFARLAQALGKAAPDQA